MANCIPDRLMFRGLENHGLENSHWGWEQNHHWLRLYCNTFSYFSVLKSFRHLFDPPPIKSAGDIVLTLSGCLNDSKLRGDMHIFCMSSSDYSP